MQELNLTPEQTLSLIVILLPVVIYLWHHLGSFQLDIEPKNKPEGNQTADKCELRGLYSITRQILQLGGQIWS